MIVNVWRTGILLLHLTCIESEYTQSEDDDMLTLTARDAHRTARTTLIKSIGNDAPAPDKERFLTRSIISMSHRHYSCIMHSRHITFAV